ncbi:MAG: hypothetical protein JWM95_2819, partial [Gemmatimonadetes bacterium]|nr:hypothetical protein [Gemmatimonadota bacterium]
MVSVLALSGCRTERSQLRVVKAPAQEGPIRTPIARRFVDITTDTMVDLHALGISTPQRLFATNAGIIVQHGIAGLTAITRSGQVIWKRDLAKDAVSRITDMQIGTADTLFVVDDPEKTAFVISPTGVKVASIPLLHVGHVDGFVSMAGGRFIAITADSVQSIVEFDRSGRVLS